MSLPYWADTSSGLSTWPTGSNIKGNKLVAAIGIASVIHQVAIHNVIAKTNTPLSDKLSGWNNNNVSTKSKGPKINPTNWPTL